jgi:methylase of polypeptide subunit release factors
MMADVSVLPPPPSIDASNGPAVRQALETADLRAAVQSVKEQLPRGPRMAREPIVRWHLDHDPPDPSLWLAFALFDATHVAAETLDPATVALLREAGILIDGPQPGTVVSPYRVSYSGPAIIVADRSEAEADTVMPPGPGTDELALMLPPVLDGKRVLDLGTGPGTLGIIAALGGAAAVAVDISDRSAAFAVANAALNGVELDVRVGDLYEPVRGELFDVVVSHPPYVIQPGGLESVAYLHGGPRGEELPLRVLGGVPPMLAEGGEAVIHFHATGTVSELADHVAEVLQPPPCDVVLFCMPAEDPDGLAMQLAVLADSMLGETYARTATAYRAHLAELGEHRVVNVSWLRRRTVADGEKNWSILMAGPRLPRRREVLDDFVAGMSLLDRGQDALLHSRLRLPAETQLRVVHELAPEGSNPTYTLTFPEHGVAADREIPPAWAGFLAALPEMSDLESAIERLASEAAQPVEEVRDDAVGLVRELLSKGGLVVVG